MMTEMDDPMVLEHGLGMRAREKQKAVLKNGVLENSAVDSPASGAMEVTEQVVGMETSPPALTDSLVDDDMSKHGDGAESEAVLEEDLSLPMKPSEGGRVIELPFESSTFSSPNSGNFNDNAGKGTAVTQKKRGIRGKNWAENDTEELLRAVLNTPKVCSRMEQDTASDPYWDAVAEMVPGRTGHECRGRMDTLKRSFSTMKNYCDGRQKEFKQLNENDFFEMKVSPRLTEAWYNQIRDYCPPRPKKKLKTNGAGNSSKSSAFASDISSFGEANGLSLPCLSHMLDAMLINPSLTDLLPPVLSEPAFVASGSVTSVTLPMEDPPARLEFPMADPLQKQAPPATHELWDDSIQGLLSSFEDWLHNDLAIQ